MNYCSLFLYFSFFSPFFFFFVFGRVTWMLAHFLSCPKRERGEQSAESSGKRRTERKQRNQRREWEGIYLSLLSLPRAFRRDTKRLQNQRGEHYSSPCQGAFDVPTYSMCIDMYIHTYILYICSNICAGIHTWMYVSVCRCLFQDACFVGMRACMRALPTAWLTAVLVPGGLAAVFVIAVVSAAPLRLCAAVLLFLHLHPGSPRPAELLEQLLRDKHARSKCLSMMLF